MLVLGTVPAGHVIVVPGPGFVGTEPAVVVGWFVELFGV